MAGGYHLFSAGDVLTAANVDSYLMNQTVMVFSSTSARDSALASVLTEGMTCYVTADDRYYIYDGANWQRGPSTSLTGRTGCEVRRAATQSTSTGVTATITFDTVTTDNDSFHSGATFTTVTVPSGLGGFYLIGARTSWASNLNGTTWLSVSGTDYIINNSAGVGYATQLGGGGFDLSAGATVGMKVQQTTGTINVTTVLQMWRVAV